jgi:hypothetical protein
VRGKHRGAGPILGGEARDDADEDLVGEGVDAVGSVTILGGSDGAGEEGGGGYMRLGE